MEHDVPSGRTDANMLRWVCVVLHWKKAKTKTETRELSRLEPVSLVIKKGRLRWFGHDDCEVDATWVKQCVKWEDNGTRQASSEDVWWNKLCQGWSKEFGSVPRGCSRNKWGRRISEVTCYLRLTRNNEKWPLQWCIIIIIQIQGRYLYCCHHDH